MIRSLDGLALLKEIDTLHLDYTSKELKEKQKDKLVVIKHTSFIYKEVLCEVAREKVTDLSDYIHIGELADQLSIHKNALIRRIEFSRKTGTKLFDWKKINNMYFVKVDQDLKFLLQNYQPFVACFNDVDNIVHCRLFGDLKIGFY